jgi:hypothetical protein
LETVDSNMRLNAHPCECSDSKRDGIDREESKHSIWSLHPNHPLYQIEEHLPSFLIARLQSAEATWSLMQSLSLAFAMYLPGVRSCTIPLSTNHSMAPYLNKRMPCGPETPRATVTVYPSCLITRYRACTVCKRMQTKTLSDDAPCHPITVSMTCRNAYNRDLAKPDTLDPYFHRPCFVCVRCSRAMHSACFVLTPGDRSRLHVAALDATRARL